MPLTDYSRFGVFCSQYTNEAGEDIRYLPRNQTTDLTDYDYWLFDSRKLVRMHFDEDENFLGGEVIRGFSFAMIWGVLIGTYSSICLAVPLLLYMDVGRRAGRAGEDKDSQEEAAAEAP